MKRFLIITISALVITQALAAQDRLSGDWEGHMKALGMEILIELHFPADTQQFPTLDVISQGAKGLVINRTEQHENEITLFCDTIDLRFEGILEGDTFYGRYYQRGFRSKFGVRRANEGPEPYPFECIEWEIPVDDFHLGGTLSLPDGPGPFPCILLISGSGQQDRDENILGFKIFRELALELNQAGWAVFRYDDRGTGDSGGYHDSLTTADFTRDAGIILDQLSRSPVLIPGSIGVLGHSEGGIIAGKLAAHRDDIAFIVLMAGPTLPGKDIILLQTRYIMEANGAKPAQVEKDMVMSELIFDLMEAEDWDSIYALHYEASMASWKDIPKAARKNYEGPEAFAAYVAELKVDAMRSAWYRYFLAYDPMDDLERLDIPVLAVFGEKDMQVPQQENMMALRLKGLDGEGSNIEAIVIPDANHLFQVAESGSPTEYSSLEYELSPDYIRELLAWLEKRK